MKSETKIWIFGLIIISGIIILTTIEYWSFGDYKTTNSFYEVHEFEDYNITFYKECFSCEFEMSRDGLPLKPCDKVGICTSIAYQFIYKNNVPILEETKESKTYGNCEYDGCNYHCYSDELGAYSTLNHCGNIPISDEVRNPK